VSGIKYVDSQQNPCPEKYVLQKHILGCDDVKRCDIYLSVYFVFAGIDEVSVDVYKGVEHSDTEDSDKSDSSDSEYASDEEQKTRDGPDAAPSDEAQQDATKAKDQPSPSQEEGKGDSHVPSKTTAGNATATASDAPAKEQISTDSVKESPEKTKAPPATPVLREKGQVKEGAKQAVPTEDSDSERELVIDLGEEQGGKDRKRSRKVNAAVKESSAGKTEGESCTILC